MVAMGDVCLMVACHGKISIYEMRWLEMGRDERSDERVPSPEGDEGAVTRVCRDA